MQQYFIYLLVNFDCPNTYTYTPLPSKINTQQEILVTVSYLPYVTVNEHGGNVVPQLNSLETHLSNEEFSVSLPPQ